VTAKLERARANPRHQRVLLNLAGENIAGGAAALAPGPRRPSHSRRTVFQKSVPAFGPFGLSECCGFSHARGGGSLCAPARAIVHQTVMLRGYGKSLNLRSLVTNLQPLSMAVA
jgi:hypothetical protein